MSASLLILSEDAVFSRMLELEFLMHGIDVRVSERAEKTSAGVILVDLDTALPPAQSDARIIGFTRSFSILSSDPERRCSMILHRPFSMEILTKEIMALLPAAAPLAVLRENAAPTEIELRGSELFFGERSVSLSPTETVLMERLISERPHPLSRTVLDALIGASAANKTDVYICFLRKKLESLTGSPMIRTVRGVGYRLE